MNPRIIIIGGGFGGVECAKTLRRLLPPSTCDIVLFSAENHMVFAPLLAEVAGASIHPDAAAIPLRQLLPTIYCRTEQVINIDFKQQRVEYENYDHASEFLPYDYVVIACGSIVNMGLIPGMADYGL